MRKLEDPSSRDHPYPLSIPEWLYIYTDGYLTGHSPNVGAGIYPSIFFSMFLSENHLRWRNPRYALVKLSNVNTSRECSNWDVLKEIKEPTSERLNIIPLNPCFRKE
ncbi:hypothetical protein CEXT_650481 [Caerostris extrusa]|uniref:Uncharacterized protein n=1 Tax=Caerostris extrusa TaxID=172846 RepID=A0AAV4MVG8_CAEEX|nr:hypothetical protein CEXT_650481 [Caerostris extrusa]